MLKISFIFFNVSGGYIPVPAPLPAPPDPHHSDWERLHHHCCCCWEMCHCPRPLHSAEGEQCCCCCWIWLVNNNIFAMRRQLLASRHNYAVISTGIQSLTILEAEEQTQTRPQPRRMFISSCLQRKFILKKLKENPFWFHYACKVIKLLYNNFLSTFCKLQTFWRHRLFIISV